MVLGTAEGHVFVMFHVVGLSPEQVLLGVALVVARATAAAETEAKAEGDRQSPASTGELTMVRIAGVAPMPACNKRRRDDDFGSAGLLPTASDGSVFLPVSMVFSRCWLKVSIGTRGPSPSPQSWGRTGPSSRKQQAFNRVGCSTWLQQHCQTAEWCGRVDGCSTGAQSVDRQAIWTRLSYRHDECVTRCKSRIPPNMGIAQAFGGLLHFATLCRLPQYAVCSLAVDVHSKLRHVAVGATSHSQRLTDLPDHDSNLQSLCTRRGDPRHAV